MELATPHHPDRACRLTRPARLIGAHLQLGGKIEKSSLWPRWSSLPAVRRDDSCLERNRAPRGPQRMLTHEVGIAPFVKIVVSQNQCAHESVSEQRLLIALDVRLDKVLDIKGGRRYYRA